MVYLHAPPECRLSIVVVSFNVRGLLRSCIHSIEGNLAGLPHEVIVVDNASRDATAEMIAKEFPSLTFIANDSNVGFCKANNQGIARASGEYVMLLNPDTELQPGAVEQMMTYLADHPDVWAVGPDLPQPLDPIDVLACGFQPSLRRAFNQYFFLSALFPNRAAFRGINLYRRARLSSATDVEWISGACILTRASVFLRVGGLDETIFMYTDDFEWCYRVLKAGGRIAFLPGAVVTHFAGSSTKTVRYRALWIWSGVWIDYFRRIHGLLPVLPFALIVAVGFVLRAGLAAARLVLSRRGRYLQGVRSSLEIAAFTLAQTPLALLRAVRSLAPGGQSDPPLH